jgi:hypothetical protein
LKWPWHKKIEDIDEELRVVVNTQGETVSLKDVKRLQRLAAGIAKKAMQVREQVYPEDVFLLWLDSNDATDAEKAIGVPEQYVAPMYTLWTEGFVGHTYNDKVYITPRGMFVVKLLKMKLTGDKRWKKYK